MCADLINKKGRISNSFLDGQLYFGESLDFPFLVEFTQPCLHFLHVFTDVVVDVKSDVGIPDG